MDDLCAFLSFTFIDAEGMNSSCVIAAYCICCYYTADMNVTCFQYCRLMLSEQLVMLLSHHTGYIMSICLKQKQHLCAGHSVSALLRPHTKLSHRINVVCSNVANKYTVIVPRWQKFLLFIFIDMLLNALQILYNCLLHCSYCMRMAFVMQISSVVCVKAE